MNTQILYNHQSSGVGMHINEISASDIDRKKCPQQYISRFLRTHWRMPLDITKPCTNLNKEDSINIVDDTINLRSEYQWLTCYIWLSKKHNIADIDRESILLNGRINIDLSQVNIEGQFLILKLPWLQVKEMLKPGDVKFTISCKLIDGTIFESSDTVTVVDKEKAE